MPGIKRLGAPVVVAGEAHPAAPERIAPAEMPSITFPAACSSRRYGPSPRPSMSAYPAPRRRR